MKLQNSNRVNHSILLIILALFLCFNLYAKKCSKQLAEISFFTADSLGVMKDTFLINEPIFIHFILYNPTNHAVRYKEFPKVNELELFHYTVQKADSHIDKVSFGSFDYSHQIVVSLKPHQRLEQVERLSGLEANTYKIKIQYLFDIDDKDYTKTMKSPLIIKVKESE